MDPLLSPIQRNPPMQRSIWEKVKLLALRGYHVNILSYVVYMQGMESVTNYAKTTLHWSPSFSVLQIYDGVLLFIIVMNGFSSLLPWASWWSTDQYYPAFIAKHSTLLPVMMAENSSWSSCESLIIITLSWWRKIIIVTYSTLSRQTSLAINCNDDGALSHVILSRLRNHYPYLVFTLSRWQSSHHRYIFMMINNFYFVLPTSLSKLFLDKSHLKQHLKIIQSHIHRTHTHTELMFRIVAPYCFDSLYVMKLLMVNSN